MFQEDFKYYKSRTQKPSLSNVIDFAKNSIVTTYPHIRQIRAQPIADNAINTGCLGLQSCEKWCAYEVVTHPGFIFIKNPFTWTGQRYWTIRCLRDYSKRPNKRNIDNQNLLNETEEWWSTCNSKETDTQRSKNLKKKMRWVTLGYHHNWDTKEYDYEDKNEFPIDLKCLCSYIAKCFSFKNYNAEAAIMNFYSEGDTLAGHTDHSEPYKHAPLLSISFGQSAVFLLGDHTKETKPMALFVNSGDILILSGPARLSYHAVPLILKSRECPWLHSNIDKNNSDTNYDDNHLDNKINLNTFESIDGELWPPYEDYLKEHRINLNVRQVLFS